MLVNTKDINFRINASSSYYVGFNSYGSGGFVCDHNSKR